MSGTTLITRLLRIGAAVDRPLASSAAESFYYAQDTKDLSVSDGSAWTVVNHSSASTGHASGILTLTTGSVTQAAVHGLGGVPLASVEPLDDTLGARYRFSVDATSITVRLDHAQAADIRFYWMAVVF